MKHELARYDGYKDSGINWLGEFPEHWVVCKLKDIVFYQEGPGIMADDFQVEGVPLIRISGMKGMTVSLVGCNFLDPIKVSKKWAHFKLKLGELLVSASATTGVVAKVSDAAIGAIPYTGLIRFKPRSKLYFEYLQYFLTANIYTNQIDLQKSGTTIQHYGPTHLGSVFSILPPSLEQKAIANYLDTKTAQIDRKIDLLTQKATQYGKLKQSLINETITRGLDKNVAMKDSGVEWIGEVPEHWETKRIKEVSIVVNGATPKSSVAENWDGELSWVTTDDLGKLNTKFITDTKRKITEKGYASCGVTICPVGSVVISGRAPIGHIGILSIKASSNQGCKTLVLNPRVTNNLYIYYSLLSSKSKLEALGRGTTFIELSTKELGLFNLPMPSLLEQKAIADYLDEKTAHIDRIIETINTQIDKLKELRKTLINDVVTGKIKVA